MDNNHDLRLRVHDFIANALRTIANDSKTCADFNVGRASLLDSINAAVASVSEEWNSCHAPTLKVLPPELLANCFAQLETKDLLRASWVSRGWRSVALLHPALWATFEVFIKRRHRMTILETLMSRSGNLPIDMQIKFDYNESPSKLKATIMPHCDRIRTISADIEKTDLGALTMPLLETVFAEEVVLPRAPRLREVNANSVRIDTPDSFYPRLLSFRGGIDFRLTGCDFFEICPSLESLDLAYSLGNPKFWPNSPAPSSMQHIKVIYDSYYDTISRSQLSVFDGCYGLRTVDLRGSFDLTFALDFFSRTGHTLHKLVLGDFYAQLETESASGLSVVITRYHPFPPVDLLTLQTVQELVITVFNYNEIGNWSLPIAHTLTIDHLTNVIRHMPKNVSMDIPVLRTLVLSFHCGSLNMLCLYFKKILQSLSRSHVHKLVISTTEDVDGVDFAPLSDLVDVLYHNERPIDMHVFRETSNTGLVV